MKRLATLIIVLSFVAAACGDDDTPGLDTSTTTTTSAATTATPDTTGTPVTTPVGPSPPTAVSITTADGLILDATVYPGGPAWVVLAHMLPADKTSWADLASLFQDEGYTVLAYNNRGYGGSEGDREPFALRIDADAALEHARAQGARGIVFGGASMNGAAAMTLGAFYDFDAIFVLSGVPSFPSVPDAAGFLPEVTEPILFVAAEDDGTAAADSNTYVDLGVDPSQFVLEAGGHGTRMLEADPDLARRIVEWVKGAVGP